MGKSLFADLLPIIGSAVGGYYGGTTGAEVGGTIGSGVGGALASQQAASQEQQAANQALQFEQGVYGNTQNQIAPYQMAGNAALNKMMGLLGLGSLPMGNYGGYGGYQQPQYSVPPGGGRGFNPSMGGSPAFGTGGGTMPGAMTGPGLTTAVNSGGYGSGNFGYGAGDYTGAGIYGPQTIQMGGQTITGSPNQFNWGGLMGGMAGGLVGGPLGAALGYKMGGQSNTFTFTDPATGKTVTAQGATNVQPTQVTIPKSNLNTPGMIIDPKTGGYVGQAYFSTPVGQQAAFHNALALGNAQSDMANNIINSAHGILRQKAKYGGVVGDSEMPASVTVGEDGPEKVHMMPGSMAWVEPNPGTMEKMRKGTQLPRSGGGGLPGKLLGGMIGNMGAPGGNLANSLAMRRSAITNPAIGTAAPMGGPMAAVRTPTAPVAPVGPSQNAMGGAQQATWKPSYPGLGGTPTSGPVQNAIGGSQPSNAQGSFNPWASNSQSQLTGGQTPQDILSQDPSYQFRFQQGLQALQNSAMARGTGLSGGYMRGAEEFGSGLASQEFNNIYSRLASLSGSGLSATGIGSQAGTGLAWPYGMASMYGGSAGAQGTLGSFGAIGQGLGNLAFLYGQNSQTPGTGTGYMTPTTGYGGYTPASTYDSFSNPNYWSNAAGYGTGGINWNMYGGGG